MIISLRLLSVHVSSVDINITRIIYSQLSVVVALSFFIYLVSFFLLERFQLKFAGGVTVGIFSITWTCLIALTSKVMNRIRFGLQHPSGSKDNGSGSKSSSGVAKRKFREKLEKYCTLNAVFGLSLCIFQVLSYSINNWITDEIPAALINIGFDVSCWGVAYW